jgi:hypothetical protein
MAMPGHDDEPLVIARSVSDEAIYSSCFAVRWIASRSPSSGAHSRDPVARNDGGGRLVGRVLFNPPSRMGRGVLRDRRSSPTTKRVIECSGRIARESYHRGCFHTVWTHLGRSTLGPLSRNRLRSGREHRGMTSNAAARVHIAYRWSGGGLAARC